MDLKKTLTNARKHKGMFCLCHPSRELLDCIRIIDFGLLPVSTLQFILCRVYWTSSWKLKTLPVASPPNTLTCAPSRNTLVIFFSKCFDRWSIWSRGWMEFSVGAQTIHLVGSIITLERMILWSGGLGNTLWFWNLFDSTWIVFYSLCTMHWDFLLQNSNFF